MSILEVKDRIPTQVLDNGAIRYGVYDENNNLLRYEYMKREDEPIEEGTPVNRTLFRNLQGDLYTSDRYNTPTYSGNAMVLSLPLTSYQAGKLVNITAPATLTNPTLNINGLGAKTINGTIVSGKKYSLVYNGASFDILNIPEAQKWILSAGASELRVTNLNEIIKIGETFDIIMYPKANYTSTVTGYINEKSFGFRAGDSISDYADFRCILCNDNKLHIQCLDGTHPNDDKFYTAVINNFTKLNEIRISCSTTLEIGTYIELIRR